VLADLPVKIKAHTLPADPSKASELPDPSSDDRDGGRAGIDAAPANPARRGAASPHSRRVMNLSHILRQAARRFPDEIGFAWGDLAILALWGALGAFVAVRRFRWEPRR